MANGGKWPKRLAAMKTLLVTANDPFIITKLFIIALLIPQINRQQRQAIAGPFLLQRHPQYCKIAVSRSL